MTQGPTYLTPVSDKLLNLLNRKLLGDKAKYQRRLRIPNGGHFVDQ